MSDQAKELFSTWFDSLPRYAGKLPAKGSVAGALVVLNSLQEDFSLSIDDHTAKGGSQIKGASGSKLKQILTEFGETRPFVEEGGRTNRGLRGDIGSLLKILEVGNLRSLSKARRNAVLRQMQQMLIEKVKVFHSLDRLKPSYHSDQTSAEFIRLLLADARQSSKEGPVAQYLVGAKLELRFPSESIENKSFSTADLQLQRHGDFKFGDTIFHVTVAPQTALWEKCKANLSRGFRVYVVVPQRLLEGSRQNAALAASGRIQVVDLESFVGQNIDELSSFSKSLDRQELRRLLETYNRRVNEADNDKSLLVELPPNL